MTHGACGTEEVLLNAAVSVRIAVSQSLETETEKNATGSSVLGTIFLSGITSGSSSNSSYGSQTPSNGSGVSGSDVGCQINCEPVTERSKGTLPVVKGVPRPRLSGRARRVPRGMNAENNTTASGKNEENTTVSERNDGNTTTLDDPGEMDKQQSSSAPASAQSFNQQAVSHSTSQGPCSTSLLNEDQIIVSSFPGQQKAAMVMSKLKESLLALHIGQGSKSSFDVESSIPQISKILPRPCDMGNSLRDSDLRSAEKENVLARNEPAKSFCRMLKTETSWPTLESNTKVAYDAFSQSKVLKDRHVAGLSKEKTLDEEKSLIQVRNANFEKFQLVRDQPRSTTVAVKDQPNSLSQPCNLSVGSVIPSSTSSVRVSQIAAPSSLSSAGEAAVVSEKQIPPNCGQALVNSNQDAQNFQTPAQPQSFRTGKDAMALPLEQKKDILVSSGASKSDDRATNRVRENGPRKAGENDHFFWVNSRRYQKLGKIGSGGSSDVYKVISQDCTIFALKKIKLKGRDRQTACGFHQEIEYLQRLQGKRNIIKLVDHEVSNKKIFEDSSAQQGESIVEDAFIYMVLEYGEIDLARMLDNKKKEMSERNQQLDENWLRLYLEHILEAVNTIHEERIVHADLKPANFMLVNGVLKLIDFGIAKVIQNDTTNIVRDSQVGTLNYMSPEAFMMNTCDERGSVVKCGRPSDIWSLGCILYQMVYGKTPFSHLNLYAKIKEITNPKHEIHYPPVPNLAVVDFMKKCLIWDKSKRLRIPELLQHPFLRPPPFSLRLPSSLPILGQESPRDLLVRIGRDYASTAGIYQFKSFLQTLDSGQVQNMELFLPLLAHWKSEYGSAGLRDIFTVVCGSAAE